MASVKILLVEDLPSDAMLAEREIRKSIPDAAVRTVDSADGFMEALESFSPDLIISDYKLPGFDGMEALRISLAKNPLLPVIITTGSMNEDIAVECMQAGAINYVIKEHIKRLGPAVKNALEQKKDKLEKIKVENELKISEEKYRTIFNNVQDVFYQIDMEGRILDISPSIKNTTTYTREELIGTSVLVLYDNPAAREVFLKKIQEYGEICDYEIKIRTKEGDIKYGSINAKLVYDSDGKPEHIDGSIREITERKRAEEKIRVLNRSVEQSPISIIITDAAGKIEYVNTKCTLLTGYSKEELFGKNPRILKSGSHPKEFYTDLWNTILSGKEWRGKIQNKKKNGDLYWEDAVISPVINEAGALINFVAIKEDITDKLESEKELIQYREHLEDLVFNRTVELDDVNKKLLESLQKEKELNELKSRFISTTSHEFRTPLTSVMSSVELIQRYGHKWTKEKFDQHTAKMKNSIEYLIRLLDDVLTISKADSGKIVFGPLMTNILEICRDTISEVLNISGNDSIVFTYQPEREEFFIDPKLLRSIISNLLSNAIKYSPKGTPVSLNISEASGLLCITVADKGIGIPAAEIKYLFEPFLRAGNTSEIPGTGLGLSIVKRAVEIHGGTVEVDSKENSGTTFRIKLPVPDE